MSLILIHTMPQMLCELFNHVTISQLDVLPTRTLFSVVKQTMVAMRVLRRYNIQI